MIVIFPAPPISRPLLKIITIAPDNVCPFAILAPPALKVPAVFVKPDVNIILAGVVTAVEVHAPDELCVTAPLNVVTPALLLSRKAPEPVIDVVPLTVKFPVVVTASLPVHVKFLIV